MCGIAGMVGVDPEGAREQVRRATECLRHRGPDAAGFYEDAGAVLGHRRLSIIDTAERSNQPMVADDGRTALVFNGEIYNYRELRDYLLAYGERFATTSDTEVLLRLLRREGVAALPKLRGMFAFGFWRAESRELLLARDGFGEKPLFIAHVGQGGLAFASEVAALLACDGVERQLDFDSLKCYFELGFVPAPRTMLRGIRAVEPGQWLSWRDGRIAIGTYSSWSVNPDPALNDFEAASKAVGDALRKAVRRQMVSDVPIGAFLSGGIDSSSVVAMMQQESSQPVKTFSVRFAAPGYDESPVARRVAAHLGTDHHELSVADASFRADDLWRIIDHVGVPFHDSSAIPMYIVSRYARQHVTVALSGDGGDEMFAGYPVFEWGRRLNQLARVPTSILRPGRWAAVAAARLVPKRFATTVRQAAKGLDLAQMREEAGRFRAIHRLFSPTEVEDLLSPDLRALAVTWDGGSGETMPEVHGLSPLRRMMYSRIRYELANDMLVKVDRMSMAASLEVRAPFLDGEVAAVSARIPDPFLISNGIGKRVLRNAMRPHLPPEVFSHPKWGFSIPLHTFINDEFRDMAHGLLAPQGPLTGLLRHATVARIARRGLTASNDSADVSVYQATHQLWALLQLAAWMERFRVRM